MHAPEYPVSRFLRTQGRVGTFHGAHDLDGNKIGLLGFGQIAQRLAKQLSGFDVEICAYDKYPNLEAAKALNVRICRMEELLQTSDIVSIHLPSLLDTYHIMNHDTFAMMKDGAYSVNTACGALVDEKAMIDSLNCGKLTMAATDVYEGEPVTPDNPLLRQQNCICTPRTSGETYNTYHDVSIMTAEAIVDYFSNKTPKNLLNG